MKILVTCFSLSGNTEMIANAICEELIAGGCEVVNTDIGKIMPASLNEYDLVFLGSACHDADLAQPVKDFLDGIPENAVSKLAGFVTHSTTMPDGGGRNQELYVQWAGHCPETFNRLSIEKGFELLGYFHCQGAASPPIEDFIHNVIITDEDEWQTYLSELRQHPNQDDLDNAKAFAATMLSIAKNENKE